MVAVKAMVHDQDLPMHLWAEATRTVVYMQNKSPQKVLENKTPEEMFLGEKSKVNHLRIFGCPRICACLQGKEDKIGSIHKEWHICWLQ
jgi:hypothetical protein